MSDESGLGPIHNRHGERIDHSYRPGSSDDRRLVVIGHGVTANKDRPFLVALADGLAAAGIASLRISFSGNGESDGRFGESTVTKEIDDLGAVLERVSEHWPDRCIAYAGHSMGGAVGLLRAVRDDRIGRLVSLAGMVDCADFARRKFGDQQPGASFMWDKPECPLSQAFMDDMAAHGDLAPLAARIAVPWLLVHGDADTVVPPDDARRACMHADPERTRLVTLDGVDHVFASADGTARMVAAAVAFLAEAWSA
ncbi:MAG: alpha/beta fold hydrolase [Planctomycetes bacterium]|nr:alpha/beta fold hydrolase [Planctomycetota bacterium]